MKNTPTCWVNGRFFAPSEARVSPFDAGFLYGDGVYDTLRVYRGRVFQEEEHLGRLRSSLRAVDIPFTDFNRLRGIFRKLVRANQIADAVLRVQITRGVQREFPPHPRFDPPTVFVALRPVPQYPGRLYSHGASVALVDAPFRMSAAKPKTTNFQINILARLRAVHSGAFEAVFHSRSRLMEGSMSNVFLVRRGKLYTPRLEGILPGITRDTVLRLARRLRIPARESACTVSQLKNADEAFLTSTTIEIMPIGRVQWGRRRRSFGPHPVADAFHAAYRELIHKTA